MEKEKTSSKISATLNKYVIGFSNNIVVKTIANGMAKLLPVTMIGSIVAILTNIPIAQYTDFITNTGIKKFLTLGNSMTNDIVSIYVVVALASEMAKNYNKSKVTSIMVSLVSFFILTPVSTVMVGEKGLPAFTFANLGARGMFVAMIVSLLATRAYVFLMDHGIKIKMHPSVPPAVSGSFESLFPVIFVGFGAIALSALFAQTSYGNVQDLVYGLLQKPLQHAGNSLGTALLLMFLGEVLWWFGIHGSMATSAITNTLYMPLAIENNAALVAGLTMPHILNSYFFNVFKGPRHFALAFMLLVFSRSKQLKAVGQVAIVPGVFGISEPMKFGIPMVFNPLLFIPMGLTPVVCISIAYFATKIGFLAPVGINIPWSMPPVISGFIVCGWQGALVQIIQFGACILIYLPFFTALDRQKVKEEISFEAN